MFTIFACSLISKYSRALWMLFLVVLATEVILVDASANVILYFVLASFIKTIKLTNYI